MAIRIWMADDRYNADARRLFASDIAEKFFHVEEIRAIFDEYVGGNSDNWRKVWTIYTFLVWYEEYFVKRKWGERKEFYFKYKYLRAIMMRV